MTVKYPNAATTTLSSISEAHITIFTENNYWKKHWNKHKNREHFRILHSYLFVKVKRIDRGVNMKHYHIIYILIVSLFIGCKSDEVVTVYKGGRATGRLQGVAKLALASGEIGTNHSRVLIQVENTPFRAVSDSTGFWYIDNLPTATYIISFSKDGYCTWKNTSFPFVGGGVVDFNAVTTANEYYRSPLLYEVAPFTLTIDSIAMPKLDTSTSYWSEGIIYSHTSKINKSRMLGVSFTYENSIDYGIYRGVVGDGQDVTTDHDTTVSFASHFNQSFFQDIDHGNDSTGTFIGYPIALKFGIQLDPAIDCYIDWKTGKTVYIGFGTPSNPFTVKINLK